MYAIIENGSKQYKVTEGDVVKFEKLNAKVGEKVEFNVLLVSDENGIKVGSGKIHRFPGRCHQNGQTVF